MIGKSLEELESEQLSSTGILVERLHRQASRQFSLWVSELLKNFWGDLERARQQLDISSVNYSTHQADIEALRLIASRQEDWVLQLMAALEGAALAWRGCQQINGKNKALALSLMSEDELCVQLHGQQAVNSVWKQLEALLRAHEHQVELLASMLGLRANAGNPWGVESVVESFTQVLPLDDVSQTLVPVVFEYLSERLVHVFSEVLPRFEEILKGGGMASASSSSFMPVSEHDARQQPASTWIPDCGLVESLRPAECELPIASGMAERFAEKNALFRDFLARAACTTNPAVANDGTHHLVANYRESLRDYLNSWRQREQHNDARGEASAMGDTKIFQTSEVLAVASILQGEDPAPFVEALGQTSALSLQRVIREQMLKAAAQLGFDPKKTCFAQDENDAIDLVAILFDRLVRDNGLPDRGARMFGKLVLPYVKMVVMDDSLFNRQAHPARRLLDALTEACEGNHGGDAFGREMLDRADRVVDQVVAHYQEDQAVFELAAQELRSLLDQQRQRMEIAEKRLAETLYGRERLKFAQDVAYQALLERIGTHPVSDGVWTFMQNYWRNALMQVWLCHGVQSRHYRDLLALGDALPKLDAAGAALRSHELAQGFTEQLEILRECVAQSGLLGEAADEAIARLLHSMIQVDTERYVRQPEVAPDLGNGGEFSDSAAAAFAATADPVLVARLRKLKVGQRLRLRDSCKRESVGKVAWISPLTSRFLIVNRYGTRRMVVSVEELACKISAGEVMVCATEAPMEQAIRGVW